MDVISLEIGVLLWAAISIGVVHTLIGPDHYLPFVTIARERNWSIRKTLSLTLLCGAGHCAGSVLLGLAGIALGLGLASLEAFESMRGDAAAWLLLGFGIAYLIYGIRSYRRREVHCHPHTHADGTVHSHSHTSEGQHAHLHNVSARRSLGVSLFIIFLLGPCEALIPLLMYPAATASAWAVVQVALVFSITTVVTMLFAVALSLAVANKFRWQPAAGVAGMLTGGVIGSCGAAMLLGL